MSWRSIMGIEDPDPPDLSPESPQLPPSTNFGDIGDGIHDSENSKQNSMLAFYLAALRGFVPTAFDDLPHPPPPELEPPERGQAWGEWWNAVERGRILHPPPRVDYG